LLFNTLVKNGDAHARNFSLYRKYGTLQLSPFYDLLNTHLHRQSDSTLACRLFESDIKNKTFTAMNSNVFAKFGEKIGIDKVIIQSYVDEFGEKANSVIDLIDNSFLSEQAKVTYKKDICQSVYTILGITRNLKS